jgi:hypothetical protein
MHRNLRNREIQISLYVEFSSEVSRLDFLGKNTMSEYLNEKLK